MAESFAPKYAGRGKTPLRETPVIMIIDDDPATNRILAEVLQRAGFETTTAFDVKGALVQLYTQLPDLILLDVKLPDGSGFDLCQQLQSRSESSQIPVLFISGHEDVTTKVRGFEAGGVDYLTKPLAGAEIIARVTTHLRLKKTCERLTELQVERIHRLAMSQQSLMPKPEDIPEANFQVFLNQVLLAGGDFYDVIQVGQQVTDYVVTDACGHDLGASFWTAAMKALLSEYASALNSPQEILRSINRTLTHVLPPGVFFTALYARLNRNTGRLLLANAAHPPACLIFGQEQKTLLLPQEGDVIGAFPDVEFGLEEIPVRPGDRFFLYSDGLIEITDSRAIEFKRLVDACQAHRAQPLAEAVRSIVRDVADPAFLRDDAILLGVEV